MLPASRSCTYSRSDGFLSSLAGFGRIAARLACHCAVWARYSRFPPRVAALRRNSREIVDADRPSCRAISRTPCPRARANAICSRSAKSRYRPVGSGADGARLDGDIPPYCRNQRFPTAGDTPAIPAASSLLWPRAIALQNGHRFARCNTGGLPGGRSFARSDRSDLGFFVFINTSCQDVLRRPVEFTQYASVAFGERCKRMGVRPSMGSVGDAYDNAIAESIFASLECEPIDRRSRQTKTEARLALFTYIEGWYNPRRRHSALEYLSPMNFGSRHADQLPVRVRSQHGLSTVGACVAAAMPPVANPAPANLERAQNLSPQQSTQGSQLQCLGGLASSCGYHCALRLASIESILAMESLPLGGIYERKVLVSGWSSAQRICGRPSSFSGASPRPRRPPTRTHSASAYSISAQSIGACSIATYSIACVFGH
jgi:hypothetical protein